MDTRELADIEGIRQLKARYFRTLDQKDWQGYRNVFTEDVVIDTGDDTGPDTQITGREAYVTMLEPMLAGAVTVHHGHMSEIEMTGPDTARGVWAMEDHIWFPESTGMGKMWGTGWYEETYERVEGLWAIATMTLRRQRVEMAGAQIFPR